MDDDERDGVEGDPFNPDENNVPAIENDEDRILIPAKVDADDADDDESDATVDEDEDDQEQDDISDDDKARIAKLPKDEQEYWTKKLKDSRSKSKSLTEMRKKLEAKPKAEAPKPRFENIKRSTDLTEEERKDKTAGELALMDEVATLKEALNSDKKEREVERMSEDTRKSIQKSALKLAGNNIQLANKYIRTFNKLRIPANATAEDIDNTMKLARTYSSSASNQGGQSQFARSNSSGGKPKSEAQAQKESDEALKQRRAGTQGGEFQL